MLKEHEDQIGKKDTQDFMDILLKVYQDDKAEVKMTRNNIKAFLTVSFFVFFCFFWGALGLQLTAGSLS